MKKELSRCGYRCDLCAARSDDPEIRQKLVDGWYKYFGHQNYTAENVRCDGCLHDGLLADKNCPVRACVIKKGLKNCAHCIEFPCDMLERYSYDKERGDGGQRIRNLENWNAMGLEWWLENRSCSY